jgi:hypothetical protein
MIALEKLGLFMVDKNIQIELKNGKRFAVPRRGGK